MANSNVTKFWRNVPRTKGNDDNLYDLPEVTQTDSLDDVAAAVHQARNEVVTCQTELARAQTLHEDMVKRFAELSAIKVPEVTHTVNTGRRH